MNVDMQYFLKRLVIAARCGNQPRVDQLVRRMYALKATSLEAKLDIESLGSSGRFTFKIDTGKLSNSQAEKYIKTLINKFRNNMEYKVIYK